MPTNSKQLVIDLNADVAEGCGQDDKLLTIVSSANICCGLHAGSATEMLKTLKLAKQQGVRVGAHPSFDDRVNFGRTNHTLPDEEVQAVLQYQLGAMQAMCDWVGVSLSYVKPHGALYNQAATDSHLAQIIAQQIKDFNPELTVMALSGGELIKAAKALGLNTQSEVFADRRYEENGALVSRSLPHAVITSDDEAIEQVLQMVTQSTVTTFSGKTIPVEAQSVCLHGDNEHAIAFAKKIQARLQADGIEIIADNNGQFFPYQ